MIDLAGVFARWWPGYLKRYGEGNVPLSHQAAARAIQTCRTEARGGSLYLCSDVTCDEQHFAYHCCGHRTCPKCGFPKARLWADAQKAKLLPAPYFMVTFTIPQQLRKIFRSNQHLCYNLFFDETAATLQDISTDPKRLDARLGFTGVLQTWSRQLIYHPHIHYIVPGGGISDLDSGGFHWKRVTDPDYLLPQKVLAKRFRNRLRNALKAADFQLYMSIAQKVWSIDWVCDVQPVGQGDTAIGYLARYVTRSAIGDKDLHLLNDNGNEKIAFNYRDSDTGQLESCSLDPHEFLRRFLQHVLPKGFRAVRSFGWMSPAAKATWQKIAALLGYRAPERPRQTGGISCPKCGQPMRLIEQVLGLLQLKALCRNRPPP